LNQNESDILSVTKEILFEIQRVNYFENDPQIRMSNPKHLAQNLIDANPQFCLNDKDIDESPKELIKKFIYRKNLYESCYFVN